MGIVKEALLGKNSDGQFTGLHKKNDDAGEQRE
jgi:hypothetical protein